MDPLLALYPGWIANCLESIRYIESGERKRDNPFRYTPQQDIKDAQEYRRRMMGYEKKLKGKD